MAWRLVRSTQNCHAVKDPKARMPKGLWIGRYERLRKVCWLAKHHATATAAHRVFRYVQLRCIADIFMPESCLNSSLRSIAMEAPDAAR